MEKSTEYGIRWKEVGLQRRIEEEGKWPKEQYRKMIRVKDRREEARKEGRMEVEVRGGRK